MRKQLGIITSLFFLCATALCWAGCSSYGYYDDCCYVEPVCPEPCKPVCPDPCDPCPDPCKPVCRICPEPCPPACRLPEPCKYGHTGEICCDGVSLKATQPKLCILGDNYALDLEVCACKDVCDVVVNAILPEGVSVIRSEPAGVTMEGYKAIWRIGHMEEGESLKSRILLRADIEGDLCVCFCVTATPVRFCSVLCAKPILVCEKCGPTEVCPGDPVHYTICVTNNGSCEAEDVVVTDNVPDGLEHSSGLRTLTFKLGTLCPCETKRINVCFTAVKRGKVCNSINVTACNATPTSCQWCTNVCKECVELIKTGPKEVSIGKTAEYLVTVINPGDKPLTDVVITDCPPAVTTIVEAKGAQICGNQAVWRLRELKPGEKQTFSIVLTTCTSGYYCNRVTVDNCHRCRATAEACTRWKGRPALNVCVTDAEDPICIGEPFHYSVRIVNQGSEEDTNVKLVVRFPEEVMPTGASGATNGTVSGQTVTFAPYAHLGPRQTLEYRVEAKGRKSGDARVKIEVSSDNISPPVVNEESTIVN